MGRLVIYGCGGHGREMMLAANADPRETVFLADDFVPAVYAGAPLIRHADLLPDDEILVAVGMPKTRQRLAEKVKAYRAATVIAPTAVVDPSAEIGPGGQICDFSFIGPRAKIGRHFQCNVRSHVHHDCVIGDFVTFSPGTMCLGTVEVGDGVFVGAGAVIRNGSPERPIRIGKGAVIGMGAVVTKSVPADVTVVGNPAVPMGVAERLAG